MDKNNLLFKHLLHKHNLACTEAELEQILTIAKRTIAQNASGGVSRYMVLKEIADRDLEIRSSDVFSGLEIGKLGEVVKMAIDSKTYNDMRANPNLCATLIIVDYPLYKTIERELKIN